MSAGEAFLAGREGSEAAAEFQVRAEREETEKLHEEKRAIGAHAARREARGEVREAPEDCAGESEKNGHVSEW